MEATRSSTFARVLAVVVAAQLAASLLGLVVARDGQDTPGRLLGATRAERAVPVLRRPAVPAVPAPTAPEVAPPAVAAQTAPPPQQPVAQAPGPSPVPLAPDVIAAVSDSARVFASQFPLQFGARQGADPASRHWALLVGVNDHSGRTRDNIGSAQDAVALRDALLARGWREDHILLLIDHAATHDGIVRGIEWLARSTDADSTVVFSYSGHVRQNGSDPDRDGEALDEALWGSDNRFIWDADLSRMLGAVRAARMWVSIQGCEGAGFNDAGMEAPGRVITYSSREDQKSYEDPDVGFSVQGNYLFVEPYHQGYGDANGDRRISVQEAFAWSAPRVNARTANRQSPIIVDTLGQPFFLELTG